METATPIEDLAQVATRWQDTMLSLEKEYEQEPEVLKIGGVPVGTLGNFSASIGKAKSKKTFNVSAMVAAALSGKEVLNYTTDFPAGKEPHPLHRHRTKSKPLYDCDASYHETGRVAD